MAYIDIEECVPNKYYLVKDYMGKFAILYYFGFGRFSCEVDGEDFIRYILKEVDISNLTDDYVK